MFWSKRIRPVSARVVLIWALLVSACVGRVEVEPVAQSLATPVLSPPRRLTQGEALYLRHCSDCHGWEGRGNGPVAEMLEVKPPSLQREELFTRYSEYQLVARILHGKELSVPLDPTVPLYTEAEVTALSAHLKHLPTIPWEQVNGGLEVYDSLCVFCHGIYGRGDGLVAQSLPFPPQDLSASSYQKEIGDEELRLIISEGRGAMPGAGDVLSTSELQAVIAFVRLLSPGYELYDRFCAVCHGPDGRPPALFLEELNLPPEDIWEFAATQEQELPQVVFDQAYFREHSDQEVSDWIQHMLKQSRSSMPHFAGELSADKVSRILTYLRTLLPES